MNTTELSTLMWAAKRAADAIETACPGAQNVEMVHVDGGLAFTRNGLRVEVRIDCGELCEHVCCHSMAAAEISEQAGLVAETLGIELESIPHCEGTEHVEPSSPAFPAELLGCDGDCGFVAAGAGYQCIEGDGCGRYVHPDDTGFAELNAYHTHMLRTEAFRTQLRRLGMVDSDDDIDCVFAGDTVRIVSRGDHGPGCTLPAVVALDILSSTAAGTEPLMVWRAFEGYLKDNSLRQVAEHLVERFGPLKGEEGH
jgi:hypothetical protein